MDNKPLTQRCDYCGEILSQGLIPLAEHFEKRHPKYLKYEPMTLKQFRRMIREMREEERGGRRNRKMKNETFTFDKW